MLLSFKWMVWWRIARNGAIIICCSKIRSIQYCRRPVILAFEQFLLGAAKACMLPLPNIYILTHRQPSWRWRWQTLKIWRSSIINLWVCHHLLLMDLSSDGQARTYQILQNMHCCFLISFCIQINQMLLKYRFLPASCFRAKCFNLDDRCMRGDCRKIHIGRNASLSSQLLFSMFVSQYQRRFLLNCRVH